MNREYYSFCPLTQNLGNSQRNYQDLKKSKNFAQSA